MDKAKMILKFKDGKLHCGEMVKRIHDQIDKHANREIQESGITFTQLKLLFVLNITDKGEATLKELEKFYGTAQSTMAGIVARLEKSEFIESFTDQYDRRVKNLRITEKGRELCKELHDHMEIYEKYLLSPLTEEEQQQFYIYLQKIYDNLTKNQ